MFNVGLEVLLYFYKRQRNLLPNSPKNKNRPLDTLCIIFLMSGK